jgi:hypothetical protein
MLNVFVPLYQEAASLIQALELKKQDLVHGWDTFINGEIRLTIMGTGKDNAVAAVSSVLAADPPGGRDFLVLFGSAAGIDTESRGLYQAVEIDDLIQKRIYYPDPVWHTGIREAVFLTGAELLLYMDGNQYIRKNETVLYDMESAGVYFAGMKHMGPHQMLFFRFVSDHGEKIDSHALGVEAEKYTGEMIRILKQLEEFSREKKTDRISSDLLERLCVHTHASMTSSRQLKQLFIYGEAAGLDLEKIVRPYLEKECRDREEGKKVLYAIEQDILDA